MGSVVGGIYRFILIRGCPADRLMVEAGMRPPKVKFVIHGEVGTCPQFCRYTVQDYFDEQA